jgi:nitroreductase
MQKRKATYPIEPLILNRWASRAMTGQEISKEELMTLFEAARWAQSSYNNQPWRFIYATRNSQYWNEFLNLLAPSNKVWAQNAGVLIIVASKSLFDYNNKPSKTHTFDTGAALQNLALQGTHMGFVVHGMEGFNYEKAREVAHIPQEYTIEAMFAVGHYGDSEKLPQELQERDFPSDRKPLSEVVFEGTFQKN